MNDASERLKALQTDLDSALGELSSWEEQGQDRRDGSGAQDRRFEERGQRLQDRVDGLSSEINELKSAANIISQATTHVLLKDAQ